MSIDAFELQAFNYKQAKSDRKKSGWHIYSRAMAPMVGEMGMICTRFKPHIFMVLIHVGYMIMYLITDAAFSHGMNPHIFVTYRHVLGGLVMFPFAYFLERYGSNLHPIHIHIHSHTGYMNNYLPSMYIFCI